MERHFVAPGVLRDLRDGDAVLTGPGHSHDVFAELLGIGSRHGAHPSRPPSGQARSDVTYPCGSPEAFDLFLTWDSRGWITEGALGVAPADAEQSFVQGTSAYTISGPWIETQYIAPSCQPREEFSTFLLPTGHDDVRHSGFIEGLMISMTCDNPDDAAALIDHKIGRASCRERRKRTGGAGG